MILNRQLGTRIFLSIILATALSSVLGGCMKQRRGPDMTARMESAPPIQIDSSENVHLIVMQAPHPGWSIQLDKDEPIASGKRVYFTIRRPDPAMLYPQMIVEKQLRTLVHSDIKIELYGRILDFNETTRKRGYALVEPVKSFEE